MMWIPILVALLALAFAGGTAYFLKKRPSGTEKMKEISAFIKNGAMSYLNRQYKILLIFVIIVAIVLAITLPNGWMSSLTFMFGAVLSAGAGNIGMRIATSSNAKTAQACTDGIGAGLKVAFSSGVVMGLTVVGLGLIGVTISYLLVQDPNILFSFGFGASGIALFARVGGGIYTKAADVGADLVGKIEAGIPEDDPRNPAVIADNVGDNVGDVAGMGADLFESYCDSIIAAIAIGFLGAVIAGVQLASSNLIILPLLISAIGIVSAIIGTLFVIFGKGKNPGSAMNKGIFTSAILMAVISFIVIYMMGAEYMGIYYSVLSGLIAGIIIGLVTEYYTSSKNKPTRSISEASQTGSATNIITGLAVGMESTLIPVIAVCAAIFASYYFGGLYGVAIAAVGMLSTLGITLATDTYGPVADNSAGIAEMAGMGGDIRKRAESLDAVGNTTAAIGKGFAIGSAALTALALFAAYTQTVKLSIISLTDPMVIIGLFIGGLLPFLFCSFAIKAVGKTAYKMVNEVRRQFKEIKGLLAGKAKPDYNKCIQISTSAALRQMILPSVIAILAPIIIGLLLGTAALGGLLAGSLISGFMLAVFMANSGGAWDNAKKFIEEGNLGGKGSDAHKAAVVGDTVGDPFKDTAGPSLNILIKLMSIIALVFVPLFLALS